MPHAERANTASFLEEVITYIQGLQQRIAQLEKSALQSPATQAAPAATETELGLYAPSGIAPATLQPPPAQVCPEHTCDPWGHVKNWAVLASIILCLLLGVPARGDHAAAVERPAQHPTCAVR